jgi:hypothetical protein
MKLFLPGELLHACLYLETLVRSAQYLTPVIINSCYAAESAMENTSPLDDYRERAVLYIEVSIYYIQ